MTTTNPNTTSSGSNLFSDLQSNVEAAQKKYFGETYPYYKYVNTPAQIGMSGEGSMAALGNDVNGLIAYTQILVEGTGPASATHQPLGNKFFLQTAGQCTDVSSNEVVDRWMYINNIPDGNIPFISSGLGVSFTDFRGLIPGIFENMNALDPIGMFKSFTAGPTPSCMNLTMSTMDTSNVAGSDTHFVAIADIESMNPCWFPDRVNPVLNADGSQNVCKETFSNINNATNINNANIFNQTKYMDTYLPKDNIVSFYIGCILALFICIISNLLKKIKFVSF